MADISNIIDFYKAREVLITGGTGFVGKSLIEKLLRSCPDIGRIFVLIRRKQSQSLNQRLNILKSSKVSINLFYLNFVRIYLFYC